MNTRRPMNTPVNNKVLPMSRTIEFNTLENSYQSW